jgi:hypothetical protein
MASVCINNKIGERGAQILMMALAGVYQHTLTPLHPEVLRCALHGKAYRLAEAWLADPAHSQIHDLTDHKNAGLTSTDVLAFNYYAGMVYTGVKNWKMAAEYYRLVS